MLVYSKEVKEVEADLKDNIMVIHRYFDLNDRNSETKLKEFLINIPYGCEIIMTNISASTQQFSMYAQVPEGCMPIKFTQYSTCQTFTLSPYQSTRFDQQFYFPLAGNFRHFPTTITIGEKAVSKAEANVLKVIQE